MKKQAAAEKFLAPGACENEPGWTCSHRRTGFMRSVVRRY
jgi:hypothetical protein